MGFQRPAPRIRSIVSVSGQASPPSTACPRNERSSIVSGVVPGVFDAHVDVAARTAFFVVVYVAVQVDPAGRDLIERHVGQHHGRVSFERCHRTDLVVPVASDFAGLLVDLVVARDEYLVSRGGLHRFQELAGQAAGQRDVSTVDDGGAVVGLSLIHI